MTTTLTEARDLLATAGALGAPLAAPAGTRIYVYDVSNHWSSSSNRFDPDSDGVYASYDGALAGLARWSVDLYNTRGDAPWACPDFFARHITRDQWMADMAGCQAQHQAAQAQARHTWLSTRTDRDTVTDLLGEEGTAWRITSITIQA